MGKVSQPHQTRPQALVGSGAAWYVCARGGVVPVFLSLFLPCAPELKENLGGRLGKEKKRRVIDGGGLHE